MYEERNAPVNEGETYEVNINAIGEKGDGIAKVKGFVLFVPNVKKGDFVKIRITKVLKNVGFAEVTEKLEQKPRESKFATVTEDELQSTDETGQQYEDTEDFGEELEEE